MFTALETFDPSQILQPVQRPEDARQDAVKWGVSQTIKKGQAVGIKTADHLAYPFATGAGDGTQLFVGFSMYTFSTDASSLVWFGGVSTTPSYRLGPYQSAPIWIRGIFDPQDLQTAATPAAQVLTFTPTTVTTGDVNTVTYTAPDGTTIPVSFTVGGTATAAAVVTGLTAAWNGNATLKALATPSGSTTFILTSTIAGNSDAITGAVVGTGTLPRVVTTAATGRLITDITTSRPGCFVMHNGFWYIP